MGEAVVRNRAASPRPPKTVIVLQMVWRLQLTVILAHQAGYPGTSSQCFHAQVLFLSMQRTYIL